jgi:flagellar hook-basal body complex protein FliE
MTTPLGGISEVDATPIGRPEKSSSSAFSGELSRALESVDGLQQAADSQAEAVAQGNGNLHEASIALEKADISMRLLVNVRNKVISAYQDVMKMTI